MRDECECGTSVWWFAKVGIALGLVVHAVGVTALGWNLDAVVALPLWVAQLVIGVGAVIVATHYAILKRASPNLARPETLITSGGFYRFVRHPMYLGDFVVIIGLALLCPTAPALSAIGVAALVLVGLARFEDSRLAERFTEEFGAYRARSSLLLPGIL